MRVKEEGVEQVLQFQHARSMGNAQKLFEDPPPKRKTVPHMLRSNAK